MEQNRFKSWALWLALAALVVFVVKEVWGVDIGDKVDQAMNLLLPVLVALGIINNPTDAKRL